MEDLLLMKDTHFYIATCVLILAVSSWLCLKDKLDSSSYVNLIEWTFAAVVAGGGVKKVSESVIVVKANGNGSSKPNGDSNGQSKPTI